MSIPPRAVQAGSCHDVSIALVTDDPPTIREREFLTGHGIGITLLAQWRYSKNQPITLSLPHAATFLRSNVVHADIIWKQTESASVNRDESFDDSDAQCTIKDREINLVIDATSVIKDKVQLWIPIKLHDHALGKRMVCTPFLPIEMAPREDIILRMYIHEDIPYIVQKIQEQENNLLYRRIHPGRLFALEADTSELELECNGEKKMISAIELFNRQKTLVSIPIATETNAKTQMINISISTTNTNQPKTSMTFIALRTVFSTDIHSNLDEMVPRSDIKLSIGDIRSVGFITKEMNTDQYYNLGLALGMSYHVLDSIQFRSRQHKEPCRITEEDGVTPNQKAAIIMVRYWKGLHYSVSLADGYLREVWKSVKNSGDSDHFQEQEPRAGLDMVKELPQEGSMTAMQVRDSESMVPGRRAQLENIGPRKRPRTPSYEDSTSCSTGLEEKDSFPVHDEAEGHSTSCKKEIRTLSTLKHTAPKRKGIAELHDSQKAGYTKEAITSWVETGRVRKRNVADTSPNDHHSDVMSSEERLQPLRTLSAENQIKTVVEGVVENSPQEELWAVLPLQGSGHKIPGERGHFARRSKRKRRKSTRTRSVRSDSSSTISRATYDEDHFQSPDEAMGRLDKPRTLSAPGPTARKRPKMHVDSDNTNLHQLNISAGEFILQAKADTPRLNEPDYFNRAVTTWIETGDLGQLSDPGPSDVSSNFKAASGELLQSMYTTSQEITEISLEKTVSESLRLRPSTSAVLSSAEIALKPGKQLPSEKQGDSSVGVHEDAAHSSRVTGNAFIGQHNIIKPSRKSHDSKVDSLDGPPRKRKYKTNRKTDSSDEEEITRGYKEGKSHGSKDDSLVGPPRALSIDEKHEDEDGSSATGHFGALGGELSSKSHGLTLHIPPGALGEDQKISLRVLTEIPNSLTLNDDEILVSHGFQCYPSGLHFKKPAKLIIPHCAIVTAPNKIQTVLYSWNQSGTPKRLPHSPGIICSVQERWLEVSISHFSGGFISLILDKLFLKGILLSCMSFLPRVLSATRKPLLDVRFVKMPHGQQWKDVHTLTDCGSQPVKDDDDCVMFRRSTLTVTCQLGENIPATDAIQHSEFDLKPKEHLYFQLDLTDKNDETLVTLNLVQAATQKIKFNTRFQEINERFTEQDSRTPSTFGIPTEKSREQDFDDILRTVARQINKNPDIDSLGKELGFDPSEIERYIQTNEKYLSVTYMGTLSMLRDWRNRTTRSEEHEKLKKALTVLKHHRLVDDLLKDIMSS